MAKVINIQFLNLYLKMISLLAICAAWLVVVVLFLLYLLFLFNLGSSAVVPLTLQRLSYFKHCGENYQFTIIAIYRRAEKSKWRQEVFLLGCQSALNKYDKNVTIKLSINRDGDSSAVLANYACSLLVEAMLTFGC